MTFKARCVSVFVSAVFILTFAGCSIIPKEEEVLAPPLKVPPKITYDFMEVSKTTIEKDVRCTGYFVSVRQSDMSFKNQSGRLKAVYVKPGDEVKKGALLAELFTDNLENQIKQQEIMLEKAQLALEGTKSNGENNLLLLKKQADILKKKQEDMTSVSEIYSDEDIQNAKDEFEKQEAVYDNALAAYQNNVKTAETDIELSGLQLENLKQNLANARLISTIDGTIDYTTDAREGEYVDSFKTIVRVADPNDLQIEYSGDDAYQFELGAKVSIKYKDDTLSGKVVANPSNMPQDASDEEKKSIRVKIDKKPQGVQIGEPADITYVLDKKDNVLAIPINLLHTLGVRKYVYILDNGIRKERDVETGLQTVTDVEIVKGLSEGDKVITD